MGVRGTGGGKRGWSGVRRGEGRVREGRRDEGMLRVGWFGQGWWRAEVVEGLGAEDKLRAMEAKGGVRGGGWRRRRGTGGAERGMAAHMQEGHIDAIRILLSAEGRVHQHAVESAPPTHHTLSLLFPLPASSYPPLPPDHTFWRSLLTLLPALPYLSPSSPTFADGC